MVSLEYTARDPTTSLAIAAAISAVALFEVSQHRHTASTHEILLLKFNILMLRRDRRQATDAHAESCHSC